MRALSVALLLVCPMAFAQVEPALSPPPVIAAEVEPEPAPVVAPLTGVTPTYAQRCFGIPGQVWIPALDGRYSFVNPATSAAPLSSFHTAQPVNPRPGPGSSPSGGGGGGMDGKALLVIAVVIVAALPVVVYALDSDAPAVVEQRFHCPSFGFDAMGGVDLGERFGSTGAGSGRFTFGYGYFGTDFQFDLSAGSINAWSGHLLLRIGPKNHIEPNLALGVRRMSLGGATRTGLEVGVPHRYVFWREGLREFGLELRPTVMFGPGTIDAGLEAAVIIPLVEPLHLRAGGKVQSFGEEIIGGFNAGLSFNL